MNRAFSAEGSAFMLPGALPQAEMSIAPVALSSEAAATNIVGRFVETPIWESASGTDALQLNQEHSAPLI